MKRDHITALNGKQKAAANARLTLRVQCSFVYLASSMKAAMPFSEPQLLYQDSVLIAASKPSGLQSVPGVRVKESLALQLQRRFGEIHIVHRLDMDTSGLILYARTRAALSHLSKQFQQRTVEKTYLALCQGTFSRDSGQVDLPLRADPDNRPRQRVDKALGRPALTHWERLAQYENHALIRLMPVTGRAHQLRVHMQAIGHPILGDPFYHPEPDQAPRLMLHAWQLAFFHPLNDLRIQLSAPLPPEFGMLSAFHPPDSHANTDEGSTP